MKRYGYLALVALANLGPSWLPEPFPPGTLPAGLAVVAASSSLIRLVCAGQALRHCLRTRHALDEPGRCRS